MWSDASLASVAPHVFAGCVLAAVRSATPGMPADETACPPFARGRWLLSHNGRVDRSRLPDAAWRRAESVCDSAVLAAELLDGDPVADLADQVARLAAADPDARLNLLLADGQRLIATAWGDTLSTLCAGDGIVVASEPYDDDPGWREVPDHTLVTVTAAGITLTPLESS